MTRTIAFLIFEDFQLLDAAGPIGAFEAAQDAAGTEPYRLRTIARTPGLVSSSSGIALQADGFDAVGPIDTLIISGGVGTRTPAICPETLAFVRKTAGTARRVASVCSGAYVLAAAGLLDGRRATTHWSRCDHFSQLYPRVRLDPDRIWIRDGAVWTSAGVTAGIDLSLALIADDLGEDVARRAAQELVVFHRRPGGQSQFSALLDIVPSDERIGALLTWARERLAEPLSVERLADRIGMTPRTFTRRFTAETGVTPAKAVERLRLEAAREAVESGQEPLEVIARQTGFSDPERMRRAFLRAFGQPPRSLRRAAKS